MPKMRFNFMKERVKEIKSKIPDYDIQFNSVLDKLNTANDNELNNFPHYFLGYMQGQSLKDPNMRMVCSGMLLIMNRALTEYLDEIRKKD